MAIFTAIATAIVSALAGSAFVAATTTAAATLFGSALVASIATGIVATGLSIGTAKLLGVFKAPSLTTGQDPGVKVQLPPSTDNKVARLYGRNYTGAIIMDAEIKNQNKTMTYAVVISEYNSNDTWSINTIYRGDQQLNFGSGANAHQVISVTDPNATSSTTIANKFRVRVYAGGSSAANQIFPVPGGGVTAVNAYGSGSGQFSNWTASNTMEDLVFAVLEMDYDAENDLVGLGAITFDINNSLNEPSNVLLDYLDNQRYGAGISNTIIDTASFDDWYTYATEQVDYINIANSTVQHNRYQIDGALNTYTPVIDNISKICQAGGAFFTYNAKQGKFGVVVNRAATAGELANAFVFTDDNITSGITITSTELYSLYNQIEVEYASVNQRDQTDLYFAEANVNIRNSNEPDNCLKYRLDMVNDRSRVAHLANVDLNQSRINTILEFTADFSSMTVDVGDVVKITLPLYGYNEKLFRAMRVTEQEDGAGMLSFKFTLMEYDEDVYGDLLTREDLPPAVTGITNWWVLNSNAVLSIGNILVVSDPTKATANLYSPVTGSVVGNTSLSTVRSTFGGAYSSGTFINVPIGVPVNVNYDEAIVQVYNDAASASPPATYLRKPETGESYFPDDETFNFTIDTYNFNKDTQFHLEIKMRDSKTGAASRTFVTAGLNNPRANVVSGDDIQNNTIGTNNFVFFAPGAQIQEADQANYSVFFPGTDALHQILDPIQYDLSNAEQGTYSVEVAAIPRGQTTDPNVSFQYYLGLAPMMNATFKYNSNSTTFTMSNIQLDMGSTRQQFFAGESLPYIITVSTKVELVANNTVGGPGNTSLVSANIWLLGTNTSDTEVVFGRGFEQIKYQFLKIAKSSK
jgi:hypothetical protein